MRIYQLYLRKVDAVLAVQENAIPVIDVVGHGHLSCTATFHSVYCVLINNSADWMTLTETKQ